MREVMAVGASSNFVFVLKSMIDFINYFCNRSHTYLRFYIFKLSYPMNNLSQKLTKIVGRSMDSLLIFMKYFTLLLLFAPILSHGSSTNVSKHEYLKMKKYLSFINWAHVKSFKTKHGHIFDCVDIYKQPAFDHPLLKNHSIQMKPSFMKEVDQIKITGRNVRHTSNEVCPPQTVPIQRVMMEDLLKAGSVSKYIAKPAVDYSVHRYAIMSTQQEGTYIGTEATFSLWNPKVDVSQFSLTQLWLWNGDGEQLNTIEAGWHVFPRIYNSDTQTRLFTYWTADDYGKTGCYNALCAGFVVTNQFMAPGAVLEPVSTVEGHQVHELILRVVKDAETGHWWLTYSADHLPVGYWPSALFNKLNNFASSVQWGGETLRGNLNRFPPMGSGQFANQGAYNAAYVKKIQVFGEDGKEVDAPDNVGLLQTNGCYSLLDGGKGGVGSGRFFYYGGPGGTC